MLEKKFDNPQEQHYETVHDAYERHYYDASSMAYRRRFIYDPLVADLDLNGCSVADLACGSGHNSLELKRVFPSVRTTGFDISQSAIRDYRMRTGGDAQHVDLTKPMSGDGTYDAALVIGGLHHCVADLEMTFANIARLVRPGGHLLMMEPSDDFVLSAVRRLWYRNDHWFDASSEAALKHDAIAQIAARYFTVQRVRHFGGPAFYAILNSLILRVPLGLKPALAAVTFPIESLYNHLPGRWPYAAFSAVWQRTDTPA